MAFARPTLTELITRIEGDLVSRLQIASTVLRRATVRILARVFAGATHGLHGHAEWAARQVFVTTADVEQLELHGAELGLSRKVATFAQGNVTFSGTDGTGIPAGARVQRTDGVEYEVLVGGSVVTGSVTVSVRATVAGNAGNATAGVSASLVSPIAGVSSVAAVAVGGIVNGIDSESDDAYRARILQRKRNPPQGGSAADFERWALEVSGVTRAWVYANYGGVGNVGVTFVMDDEVSIIPTSPKVAEVQTYMDDTTRRPVASTVIVFAPSDVPLALSIQLIPNTAPVQAAVTAELQDLLAREGEPDSTLLLSHINAAISNATGETNHVLLSPAVDQVYTASQIPTLGTITWS